MDLQEQPEYGRMNTAIKGLWLEDLRSGKYKQIRNKMCTSEGFCGLGLLADLCVRHTNRVQWLEDDSNDGFGLIDRLCEISRTIPTTPVCRWSGLPRPFEVHGLTDRDGFIPKLYELNDDDGMTFSQIADVVEYFL